MIGRKAVTQLARSRETFVLGLRFVVQKNEIGRCPKTRRNRASGTRRQHNVVSTTRFQFLENGWTSGGFESRQIAQEIACLPAFGKTTGGKRNFSRAIGKM